MWDKWVGPDFVTILVGLSLAAGYFLKALLLMAKSRSPTPSTHQVIGQGNGKPGIGLGILATISITSTSNSALPIIKSHLDAFNMVHLLLP